MTTEANPLDQEQRRQLLTLLVTDPGTYESMKAELSYDPLGEILGAIAAEVMKVSIDMESAVRPGMKMLIESGAQTVREVERLAAGA